MLLVSSWNSLSDAVGEKTSEPLTSRLMSSEPGPVMNSSMLLVFTSVMCTSMKLAFIGLSFVTFVSSFEFSVLSYVVFSIVVSSNKN